MYLKSLEINGFKSFAKKGELNFDAPISGIVGPNGSGKSNIAEAFRFVLGEQSFKSMRGKRGEDLIFGGTAGGPKSSRASVKVIFDNSDNTLPVDFSEVTIERVVHRDGVNDYFINGSPSRLKDISELLASANIGSSGHHIISQGEADKILNSSVRDRRAMMEEALGLRIFQYKKAESEKKLKKTEDNIEQVQSLRREIAPHIKFLKKQVEKIEEGKKMKAELLDFYKTYLKIESQYLSGEKERISESVKEPKERLEKIDAELIELEKETKTEDDNELANQIKQGENDLSQINAEKSDLNRAVGRLEGQISSLNILNNRIEKIQSVESVTLHKEDLEMLKKQTQLLEDNLDNTETLKEIVGRVVKFIREKIKSDNNNEQNQTEDYSVEIKKAETELAEVEENLKTLEEKSDNLNQKLSQLREQLESDKSSSLEAEKKIIALMSEKNRLQQIISEFAIAEDNFGRDTELFKQEMTEAAALVGRTVLDYENEDISEYENEERQIQLDRRKSLERKKIKVEETVGAASDEVITEYEEVTERDTFLIGEIEDLEKSAVSLGELIKELDQKIETKFKEGLQKINTEFQRFFELMFGGGNAALKLVEIKARRKKDTDIMVSEDDVDFEEDQEAEEGVDISVNLPRKKIKDLMMLSGGERALTSIALLFAISQVNPPPFIILDETDAALDEANSRKYSDMIESLSKYSQLILITHNRETMSRAGMLYGVTMIQGVSQLLSISFEKGVEYAK
jgi:chromosome segregation ATPase